MPGALRFVCGTGLRIVRRAMAPCPLFLGLVAPCSPWPPCLPANVSCVFSVAGRSVCSVVSVAACPCVLRVSPWLVAPCSPCFSVAAAPVSSVAVRSPLASPVPVALELGARRGLLKAASLVYTRGLHRPCRGHTGGSSPAQGRSGDRPIGRDGAWPSGKARVFGSRIRRFESFRPNHLRSGAEECRRVWHTCRDCST
jgi:hypothetical protein